MIGISSHVFLLLLTLQTVAVVKANSEDNLVRRKRLWIPPPKQLMENEDYTQETVAKIHSDFDDGSGNIVYSLEGIGANQQPFNVFVVDHITGDIRVTKVLDRELIDTYNLSGIAKYKDGRLAEENVDIRFKVKDQNDNPPVFAVMKVGEVTEISPLGTSVMKIMATDADEPGNENSLIAYTILDQSPPHGMFDISQDGTVFVKNQALDREVQYELHPIMSIAVNFNSNSIRIGGNHPL
ncbi:desmoglein-2-like [Notothenia coriiceps]|uniref:Desmoglein-2-like n=1 Tax=Notothenia coriiceps TaxID=8208 RepID=A0A6I9P6T5_9TELE|nr:PREDICTED: desmoglein-2-like [Notothenia coriiceps]